MATVTNTIKLPDGSTPSYAAVVIELVASTTSRAAGWITANDTTILSVARPTVTAGAWTASLTPNADITPSGTVYKVTETADKVRYIHYIEVDSDGGSVFDLLVDPPASLASAALSTHIDDTSVHGIADTSMLVAHSASPSAGSRNLNSGGTSNSIGTGCDACAILGGGNQTSPNVIAAGTSLNTIVGGYDNTINGTIANCIVCGMHSSVATGATHANIFGGSYLTIGQDADYAAALGGTQNAVNSDYGAAVGGAQNTVSGNYAATLGGSSNTASGLRAVVIGGTGNSASNSYAIASGINSEASGSAAVALGLNAKARGGGAGIVGGDGNTIGTSASPALGDYSAALGGLSNLIGQSASARFSGTVGGRSNTIDAEYCGTLGGREIALSTRDFQSGVGYRAAGTWYGAHVHAAGYFAAAGDAQYIRAVARNTTTNSTLTGLFLDGTSLRLLIPNDRAWAAKAMVVARRTDGSEFAAYEASCLVLKGSTSASTTLKAQTVTAIHEDVAGWDFTFAADTSFGSLSMNVTGESGKTIRWVATVEITQVG